MGTPANPKHAILHRIENGKIAEEWQVMVVGTTIK
jgi:hypothetical protein